MLSSGWRSVDQNKRENVRKEGVEGREKREEKREELTGGLME